jgi:hypothetical protein
MSGTDIPRTEAGRRLLRYSEGLPSLFTTPTWRDGILAIEAEAAADPGLADIAGHTCPQCRRVASRAEAAAGPRDAAVWNIDADGIPRSPDWWDGYRVGMAAAGPRDEGLREVIDVDALAEAIHRFEHRDSETSCDAPMMAPALAREYAKVRSRRAALAKASDHD